MKVHELQVAKKQSPKRLGRGIGSGTGKTAGRGTKGQNSRAGGGVRPGFEGGQNPLYRRIPKKRGFKPYLQVKFRSVNVGQLENLSAKSVDIKALIDAGLVKDDSAPVKLLGNGEIKKALNIKVNAVSASAKAKVAKAGGKVELVKF